MRGTRHWQVSPVQCLSDQPDCSDGHKGREFNLRIRCISDLRIEQIVIAGPHRDFLKGIVVPPTGAHRGAGSLVPQFRLFAKGTTLNSSDGILSWLRAVRTARLRSFNSGGGESVVSIRYRR